MVQTTLTLQWITYQKHLGRIGNDSQKRSQKKTFDLISLFLKNRCRKLTRDDVDKIYDDIEEEVLLSGPVFDMAKKPKETKEDWK